MTAANSRVPLSEKLELERIVGLEEAAQLSSLSRDTIERNHPDKIIRLSKRRLGMKLKHVFALHTALDAEPVA
jgi:hypothetical protein